MKWFTASLALGLLVPVVVAEEKSASKELEGTWEVVKIEANGMRVDGGEGSPDKAVIKDGKLTLFAGGKPIPTMKGLTLEIDPKKKPKVVDLVRGEKESLPCIYEVSKEGLKLAMPLVPVDRKPGERLARPKSFDTKGKPVIVLTAKRGE